MGVRGPGGVLGRGRPRRRASKAPARPKGEGQGRAREASGSPKGGAPRCGPRQVAAGWGSSHGRWGSQAAEVGGEPGGQAAAAAAQRPSNGVRRLTAQATCCERHLVGCQGMGARRAGPGLGQGWRGAGPGPSRPTLGFSRPALGPGRPGPWPPRLPGSRACPSSPVHGRSCPRGTAILRRPACLGLGHAQPTAGSWQALGPSCRSVGQRLATRSTGVGLDGLGRGGDGRQGSRPWCVGVWCRRDGAPEHSKEPHREPKGPGPRPPPAPSTPTPARPGSPGRVRPGRKQARCCLAHRGCPGRCSPRPVSSQPPQRGEESAPLGERPVLAREGVPRESRGAPSRRWPVAARGQGGRGALSSMTCWHGLLGENPPRALGEVRGLGWAPEAKGPPRAGCREWQGTAPTTHPHPDPHGHRAPPHPHWPSQAQAGALPWAPRSMGGHGGREARRAAYHTPRRRTLPMQAPGQGPGPGLGGGGNPWKRQAPPAGPPCLRLAWGGQCPRTPAELSPGGWCLAPRPQASAQGRRPGFGIRPWHRPWQGSPGSGQRVTGLSPKHATAGEARTGRLCPQHRRPPWTRRWQSPSRVVSWSEGLGPDRPSRA